MDIRKLTVVELQQGLRDRLFSAHEVAAAFLRAIETDTHNALLRVNESALVAADRADERLASGTDRALCGIPFAAKDNLTTKGLVTTAASKILENYTPPYTATAIERLETAGMVLLGKTNCDEFAMGSSNENSAFGPVTNPHDPERVPGGSSGGSAAAVAANLAPAALGTDTGGSIRQPAAFCGLVGLKPTYGRISRYGLIAMASSLDQIGIITRTARDCAYILREIAGYDSRDATSSHTEVDDYIAALDRQMTPLTIGLPREFYSQFVDGDLESATQDAVGRYGELPDITLKEVSLPHTAVALPAYYVIMSSEVSANLARYDGLRYGVGGSDADDLWELYLKNRNSGLGAEVRRRIMLGTFALSSGYIDRYYAKASKVRRIIAQEFDEVFKSVDLLLAPTTPTPAFKLGEKMSDPLTMYLSDIYTVSANLTGLPAVSFPAGSVRGLPFGMQLMGPRWSEATLLSAADYFTVNGSSS